MVVEVRDAFHQIQIVPPQRVRSAETPQARYAFHPIPLQPRGGEGVLEKRVRGRGVGVVVEEGVGVAGKRGGGVGVVHGSWWGRRGRLEGQRCESREVEDGVESRRSSGGGPAVSDCSSPLAALLNGRGGRGKGGGLRSLK